MELQIPEKAIELPENLPVLPIRDVVVFPYMTVPLQIARDISLHAIEKSLKENRLIMLLTQKDPQVDIPDVGDLYEIGTVGLIVRMVRQADEKVKVLIQGLSKARLERVVAVEPCLYGRVQSIREPALTSLPVEVEALMRSIQNTLEDFLEVKGLPNEILMLTENISDPGMLADLVAANLHLRVQEAQELLELSDPVGRLDKVREYLQREVNLSQVQARIQSHAKDEISKTQKEYYLREQLKAIQGELGDLDEKTDEVQKLRELIEKSGMPPAVEKEALKQLKRLESMSFESAEASTLRTYLDWMVELPWNKSTQDNLEICEAERVLNEDHYDLEPVKVRILEYLSVRRLRAQMRGPILCFVGPPGVGKTSLGRSIARAMGRKFFRMSLGGVHDEAEIRGHRRTYVGALPGRIIQGIKQAGSSNPIFMIDEVDKIGHDFRGDPAAALLEVLDPEQNKNFSDHYLNVPFDLSGVMFITTANQLDPIPPALRDRMEVIRIPGYAEEEKIQIARTYLIPRQMEENGLTPENLCISPPALRRVISEYTKEAGLRNLEREIARICRKTARKIAQGEGVSFRVTAANLHLYLGPPRHVEDDEELRPQVGQANGLAWTEAGGEVLCVEASILEGSGEITLTGQLGDVMKESARAALSYAKACSRKLGVRQEFHNKHDVHIHVPAGAIPKDGPSAGVAIAVALVSALTGRPVRHDIAMTGEITLRGRVFPVGGVKEKVLGAHRSGIQEVFLPARNRRDLAEIPASIRKKMKFTLVSHVDGLLEKTLLDRKPARGVKGRSAAGRAAG